MEYVIHNVSRGRHNRTARAQLPQNPRMKQYVGADQRRVVRGQPILVSEDILKRDLEELRSKHAAHIIEVRTRDGRLVDLATLTPAAATPSVPMVNKQLDSVANDKNFKFPPGYKFIPPYQSDDATMPQLVTPGDKPALLKEAEEREEPGAAPEGEEDVLSDDALENGRRDKRA